MQKKLCSSTHSRDEQVHSKSGITLGMPRHASPPRLEMSKIQMQPHTKIQLHTSTGLWDMAV